jgi:hypothetical protein
MFHNVLVSLEFSAAAQNKERAYARLEAFRSRMTSIS